MSTEFRQAFRLGRAQAIRWFPGHMNKGLKQMQQKLRSVDCIIEVHDARVPYSGRNPEFQQTIAGGGVKPHILVLNKRDLAEVREEKHVAKELAENQGVQHVLFTNCRNQQCKGLKQILPLAQKLVSLSDRYNRSVEKDLSVMIIGVPNVGKSSLVNVLRNRHLHKKGASQVGALAGVTRSVLEKIKISDDPLVHMIDTPGILEPRITDDEMGLKLALVGSIPDHLVGEDLIADYLLYWLNRKNRFGYVPLMGLQKPTDSIAEVLTTSAKQIGAYRKLKRYDGQIIEVPDTTIAAKNFIKHFRKGALGGVNLDR